MGLLVVCALVDWMGGWAYIHTYAAGRDVDRKGWLGAAMEVE